MINRRKFIEVCATAMMLPTLARSQTTKKNRWTPTELTSLNQSLVELERASRGRLGVSILDTTSGQMASYRGDERFMMLSTFKTLAASYVLARADRGDDKLNRRMPITQADILEHAPVTQRHLGPNGMTLADLCQAAVTTSDNTAANLLHRSYGGPEALTKFIRSLGDRVTRHDRYEPELNNPHPSEPMDTTSPNAMSRTLNTLLFGTTLQPESRHLLQSWLKGCVTGDNRLRAGIPSNWVVGEKTGTARVAANDAGFVQPPGGTAVIVSAYLETDSIPAKKRDQIIASVGEQVADLLSFDVSTSTEHKR